MTGVEFSVVGLHDQPFLIDETITVLNEQWHRSIEARRQSICENVPELPCSLLLLSNNDHCVCGHVRLLRVMGQTDKALIESLVITRQLRGCGLGRRLMSAAEDYIKKLGYKTVHLSTHDQHNFYKHIGYIKGPCVDGQRKCNVIANLTNNSTDDTNDDTNDGSYDNSLLVQNTDHSFNGATLCINTPLSSPAPPPPPGPPPPVKTLTTEIVENVIWYMKQL